MPNFLIIVADDMRDDELVYMPNTRRMLRGRGTNFICRTDSPVCGPTRAALWTGQHSTTHGRTTNPALTTTQLNGSMFKALDTAGYRVGHVGKQTAVPTTTQATGFDFWRALHNSTTANPIFGYHDALDYLVFDGTSVIDPNIYQDYYLTQQALAFINGGTEPWVLSFCPTSNHWPWQDPPNHADDYTLESFPLTLEADVTDKPSFVQSRVAVTAQVASEIQDDQRHRLRELRALDDTVGALIATIDATGQSDDTYIFFTSDNGMMLGEHNIYGGSVNARATIKNLLYEPSLRAPLVVRGPGFERGTCLVPTQQQDIVATILDIANVAPILPDQSGLSLVTILADPDAHMGRQLLHYRDGAGDASFPSAHAITTATRKLVRWVGETGANQFEMYDLDTDPDEFTNVAYVSGRLTERNTLETAMNALLA
jgi:N-acetylglucosamine-6-sulfatase